MLRKTAGDGSITSMFLSDDDVLTLIQSVPSYSSRILSKRSPSGADYSAVFVTEVARIGLHEDALGESILLSLYAPSGANQTYALSKDIAVALSDRLPIRLAGHLQ